MAAQEQPPASTRDLRTSLIATTAVIITVLLAIFLAATDSLQDRLPAPIRPVIETIVAAAPATSAPPVTVPRPSPTATPSPTRVVSATPTSNSIIASAGCGSVPAGWVPYVVRPGDTLYHLSINSGATLGEITQANCLGMSVLTAGTVIYLPSTPPIRPSCGPPQWWVPYMVQRGDTLFLLAVSRGTSVHAIMEANCLSSTYIQAGRSLLLPPQLVTPVPTATLPPPTAPLPPPPTATSPPPPTATDSPPLTATPTATPPAPNTPTPTPSNTPPASPSATPGPSATPLPSPTSTSLPSATFTPPPTPTDTPVAPPTNTSTPPPPNTPRPSPTSKNPS